MLEKVEIQKLVHGGQGLGLLSDGRKVFVWNSLPGETIKARLTKRRKDYCEAVTEKIIVPSPERVMPKDDAFMSTSPWQIMTYDAENKYKQEILSETMQREKVLFGEMIKFHAGKHQWQYRNKMEYSFWADDVGLHLALFHRGTHGKQIVPGSSIARPEIDKAANNILQVLNESEIRGSQLKTVIIRCNQKGETVAALFVKDEHFPELPELETLVKGIVVCFSTPKSPASVITKTLYRYGDITLEDKILNKKIRYGVHSFFQVNLPIFEQAVTKIDNYTKGSNSKIDLYCGVGAIGTAIGGTKLFVDIDKNNCEFAKNNVDKKAKVIQVSSEKVVDYIVHDSTLIVDPPRAGLHSILVEQIITAKPEKIVYLSCNPSTQARDIALLQTNYRLESLEGYNFFPRTPHIESLAILYRK